MTYGVPYAPHATEEEMAATKKAIQEKYGFVETDKGVKAIEGTQAADLMRKKGREKDIIAAPRVTPEIITLETGGSGYFDEFGNWNWVQPPMPELPAYPELPFGLPEGYDPYAQLEGFAPTAPTYQPLTQEQLLAFIRNSMLAERVPVQDPETNEVSMQRLYTEEDILNELQSVQRTIAASGFGPQSPYYGVAQQYYAQIAGVEAGFNTGQMTASEYMDFQLALMQMVNQQNIAAFQAQMQQATWGIQLQLSQQELTAQLQIAMMPYQQMTAWQQAQIELAQEGDPMAQARLELERELGLLPYEEMTQWQQQQAEAEQQRLALDQERLALDEQIAMLPYQGMTVLQQAQLEQQIAQRQAEIEIAQQQLALQEQEMMLPYQGMTAAQQAQFELAQLPYEQMTVAQQAELELAQQQMMLPYEQMTPWQEEQMALAREQLTYIPPITPYQEASLAFEQQQLQAEQAMQQQILAQQMEMAQMPYEGMTAYQQSLAEQAERAYEAQLRAQPATWLQHAAYTGQPAVVQPWMPPLMPQEYGQVGVGEPIPGFAGTEGMTGMPALTTPSRQYQARMGPTAMQQYGGYEQARTGIPPEELEFRLWSQAPPAGRYGGLRYTR